MLYINHNNYNNYRSSLVPVYSFGENNVYETFTFKEDNWIYIFQRKFKKYMGLYLAKVSYVVILIYIYIYIYI